MECKELLLGFMDSGYYDPENEDEGGLLSDLMLYMIHELGYGLSDGQPMLDQCIEWLQLNID